MKFKINEEILTVIEIMIEYPDDYNLTEYEHELIEELYEILKRL